MFEHINDFMEDVKTAEPDERNINFSIMFTEDGYCYLMNETNSDLENGTIKLDSFSFNEWMAMYLNKICVNILDKNILCYHIIASISKYGASKLEIDSNAVEGSLENILAAFEH